MPDQPSPVHFRTPEKPLGPAICGEPYGARTSEPGRTTCFTCRRTEVFKQAQMGMPIKLSAVLAEGVGVPTPAVKNERGFYTIEEVIHHGEYRSTRYVEVHQISPLTVDCILQTSAYCYGSWLHPENPDHLTVRRAKLMDLVDDLREGRANRQIGWSTFRTITPDQKEN